MLSISRLLKGLGILNETDQTKQVEILPSSSSTTNTKTTVEIKQSANRTLSTPNDAVSGELLVTSSNQTLTNKTIVVANNTVTTAPSGNLVATELNAALSELQSDIDTRTLETDFQAHLSDAVDAHDASAISNVPSGNVAATDVQSAINELQSDIDTRTLETDFQAHLNDTVDAHDASAISVIPYAPLTATDVQTTIEQLQDQISVSVGGANVQLSNLSTTSINQSLNPATNAVYDLGSNSNQWRFGRFDQSIFIAGSNQLIGPNSVSSSPSGIANPFYLRGLVNTGVATVNTIGVTSGSVFLETGNSDAQSGNISLRTGTSIGTRGNIFLDAPEVQRRLAAVEVLSEVVGRNISLTSNVSNSVISDFTTPVAQYKSLQINYSCNVGTEKRTGTLLVSTNGTTVAIADTFVETALTTLSFSAVENAGFINIRQTNTELGVINMSYKLLKFKE